MVNETNKQQTKSLAKIGDAIVQQRIFTDIISSERKGDKGERDVVFTVKINILNLKKFAEELSTMHPSPSDSINEQDAREMCMQIIFDWIGDRIEKRIEK